MRIGENLPSFYTQNPAPGSGASFNNASQAAPIRPDAAPAAGPEQPNYYSRPGVTVDVSPETWAAYQNRGGGPGAVSPGLTPSVLTPSVLTPSVSTPSAAPSVPSVPSAPDLPLPAALGAGKTSETAPAECQTCKNRRYQDQSDDSSVSFQSPTHISPGQSFSAVRAHENEHVTNEQSKADKEGRRVVSQTVSLQMASCPECGRMYVAGGVTRTVTANDNRGQTQPDRAEPRRDAQEA